MIKKMNIPKTNTSDCPNALGNGADWIVCNKTKQRCPHQRWCVNKKIYELIGFGNCPNKK